MGLFAVCKDFCQVEAPIQRNAKHPAVRVRVQVVVLMRVLMRKNLYLLILKNIIDQSYQQMKNNLTLIEIFNKKYNIDKNIELMSKEEIIEILLKFDCVKK